MKASKEEYAELGRVMTAFEAANERFRVHENPSACYSCKHSRNDMEEGWICKRYDAVITLSSGLTLDWPAQACDRAYKNDCNGAGFEKSLIPRVFRIRPLLFAPFVGVLFGSIIMLLERYGII